MARFGPLKDNYDRRSVEICDSVPYAIPNILVDYQLTDAGIPIGFWRSVGASQNGFFLESFIDEICGRREERSLRTEAASAGEIAEAPGCSGEGCGKVGWGTPLAADRFRGIAVVSSYLGYVAQLLKFP